MIRKKQNNIHRAVDFRPVGQSIKIRHFVLIMATVQIHIETNSTQGSTPTIWGEND